MDHERILNTLSKNGTDMITTKAAEEAGISRAMLSKLCREGRLQRIARGQYIWPGGKFCVSVFRQNQEYHVINVHDGAYSPWLHPSRKVGAVCAPRAA